MRKQLADSIREKARRIADDDSKLRKLVEMVKEKLNDLARNEKLQQLFHTVELLIKMVKSYLAGDYREYPKRTLLLILFGLIYFLIPLDAIPDFIPVTGFIDDLTVLLWVYKSIQKDITAFQDWEKQKAASENS